MKAMKIWRKSRLSECHANLFANGRVRAIYVNIFVMCAAMLSLASCNSDDNVERRLTTNQKERYAQNISGEYSGEYEKGRHIITKAHEATFGEVQLDVSDNKMQHIFFQNFPVSLISKVVDADEGLSHALAGASPQAITARYGFDYDSDYSHIKWAFIPNVMLLNLNYGGADHHIRLEFNNNSQYYTFTKDELQQPKAFRSLAENGIYLQLEAIYDGSTLIQRFGYEKGNYMHIIFKTE